MSLKRSRSHQYGFSNIDFRTKQDKKSIQLFQPWISPKDLGTMGYSNYSLPDEQKDNLLQLSSSINKLKNISTNIPNPKTYEAYRFYEKNNMRINKIPLNEEISQLNDSLIRKEPINGDSMMISEITKARKNIKLEKMKKIKEKRHLYASVENLIRKDNIFKNDNEINTKKQRLFSPIIKSENEKINVNINDKTIFEKKVDLNKVKKIRDILRKRYAFKINSFNVYKIWNDYSGKEINLIQVHNKINSFGIPITYNETKALIASANERGTENLNLREFTKLIFDDNSSFKVNTKELEYKDEEYYRDINENKLYDKLNLIPKKNSVEQQKEDINYLEDFLKYKIQKLSKIYKEKGLDETNINYNNFVKSIQNFSIPERYFDNNIIEGLIEKFKNDKSHLNFKKFSEYCLRKTTERKDDQNNFFQIQDKGINYLEKKLIKSQSQIYENKKLLREFDQHHKDYLKNLQKLINEKDKNYVNLNKNYNFPLENEINSMQPSTAFLNKIYSRNEEYKKKHDEIEKNFMALPSLISDIKPKTRSGANPILKNTFKIIQPEINTSMYINENDRFKVKSFNDKIDFIISEKNNKMKMKENHQKNLLFHNNLMNEYSKNLDLKAQQKIAVEQANKVRRIYNYEQWNKSKNQLIE
jgi:hypothetical protein